MHTNIDKALDSMLRASVRLSNEIVSLMEDLAFTKHPYLPDLESTLGQIEMHHGAITGFHRCLSPTGRRGEGQGGGARRGQGSP